MCITNAAAHNILAPISVTAPTNMTLQAHEVDLLSTGLRYKPEKRLNELQLP